MTISNEVLEEKLSALKEDIQEFKKKEADEGKRFNKLVGELFDNDKSNLHDINEVAMKCDKAMAEFKLSVESKISKINVKIAVMSGSAGAIAGFITKFIGG